MGCQFAVSAETALRLLEGHVRQDERARLTARARRRVERLLRRRWLDQKKAIVKNNTLRNLSPRETVPPEVSQLILRALLPGAIQHTLQGFVTETDVEMFEGELRAVIRAGAGAVAADLKTAVTRVDLGEFERTWIRQHGFEKLARDIDQVTVDRLRNHVGEVYQNGGSYADMVRAIRETFDGFTEERASLIATTEMNAAYNHGGLEFARNVGAKTKNWNPLGDNVCPICLDNQAEGDIPVEGAFGSGDESPPAHPRCECVLDFGFI